MSDQAPEEVLWESHPSYWNWCLEVCAADLCALAAAALAYKRMGALAVGSTLGVAAAIHLFVWARRRSRIYRLTNQRAISQLGFLSKHVSEIEARDIRGIDLRQGFLQRLVGIGDVEIVSAAEGLELVFEGIANAAEVKERARAARLAAGEKVLG